jgi:hypothetical protein
MSVTLIVMVLELATQKKKTKTTTYIHHPSLKG